MQKVAQIDCYTELLHRYGNCKRVYEHEVLFLQLYYTAEFWR